METTGEGLSNFESLPLARTEMPGALVGAYRVYQDAHKYATVQASSALEALELSGFGHAFKIERESLSAANLLNPKFWEKPQAVATPQAEAPAAPATAENPAEPAGEALSNNDVDKLLGDSPPA